MKELGKKIVQERKKAKLSRESLARKCGVSVSAIQKYERGERLPKLETIQKIADVLNVPVSQFLENWYFVVF